MIIRSLQLEDIQKLREIHEKYYKEEFEFPDMSSFINAFVSVEDGEIIAFGGVRNIAESIAITDRSRSPRKRKEALLQILDATSYTASKFGFNQIHAFVQDDIWRKHLEKIGFHSTKGQALVLEL